VLLSIAAQTGAPRLEMLTNTNCLQTAAAPTCPPYQGLWAGTHHRTSHTPAGRTSTHAFLQPQGHQQCLQMHGTTQQTATASQKPRDFAARNMQTNFQETLLCTADRQQHNSSKKTIQLVENWSQRNPFNW
jgi:hypothetical protein